MNSARPQNIDQMNTTTSPYMAVYFPGPLDPSADEFGTDEKKAEKKRRFFGWMLRFKKSSTESAGSSLAGSSSSGSSGTGMSAYSIGSISPRTPDSSRSVSFDEAINWPFIDDEVQEEEPWPRIFGFGGHLPSCDCTTRVR